ELCTFCNNDPHRSIGTESAQTQLGQATLSPLAYRLGARGKGLPRDAREHLKALQAGNRTSARVPLSVRSSKVPPNSSRTSARTIERPVPLRISSSTPPSSEIASSALPLRLASSIRTSSPPC